MGACKINAFHLHYIPDLQQIWTFFTFQGSAAMYLSCGWNHYMALLQMKYSFQQRKNFKIS